MAKQFRVMLKRSLIGCSKSQRETVHCIGLHKIRQNVVVNDTPAMRGQISKVQHLLEVKAE
jgi:large subunit ribosomal protein L30